MIDLNKITSKWIEKASKENRKAEFQELQSGIQRISSFIHSEKFQLEKAITHASKAAYIATIIEHDFDLVESL